MAVTAALAVSTATVYAVADRASDPDWKSCGDGTKAECTKLAVPIDHADPDGDTVDLGLAKLSAQDPENRRGTIIFHGGGPAPSVPLLTDEPERFEELTQWFDVVSFDSRGLGTSEELCDADKAPPVFPTLDSEETYRDQQEANAAYAETCAADNPALAKHVSAEDVANDIDLIRQAVGEDKIVYYGNFYGTVYGQEYAEHHGEHLERLLLDSVADHTVPYTQNWINAAPTADAPLETFAKTCETDPECALHGQDVLSVWDEVVTAAEAEPLPVSGGGTVSHFEIRNETYRDLTGDYGYRFAEALAQARDEGVGDVFAELRYTGTGSVGHLPRCLDFPTAPDDYESLLAAAPGARDIAPRVGWSNVLNTAWQCAGWPGSGTNPPRPLAADEAPPTLLVNGTLDQA
ncbi:MAG: alpha/beta fold hydrolase, partial [Stackebrandtia sp.]